MEILKKINLVLVIFLSISAGIAKVTINPNPNTYLNPTLDPALNPIEAEFYQNIGVSETQQLVFGITQIISGLLIISKKLRKLGAILAAVMFSQMTIFTFVNEWYVIGALTILPIILTCFIIRESE